MPRLLLQSMCFHCTWIKKFNRRNINFYCGSHISLLEASNSCKLICSALEERSVLLLALKSQFILQLNNGVYLIYTYFSPQMMFVEVI
jgi:hypothetical protein